MKLLCLDYKDGPRLNVTLAGMDTLFDWLRDHGLVTIQMGAIADPSSLPDFPESSTGAFAFSSRAAEALGTDSFKMVAELAIPGATSYQLGWQHGADDFFEKRGFEFMLPLKLKGDATPSSGAFVKTGGSFTGLAGPLLVSQELWAQIEAAGLTGLQVVAEYEVFAANAPYQPAPAKTREDHVKALRDLLNIGGQAPIPTSDLDEKIWSSFLSVLDHTVVDYDKGGDSVTALYFASRCFQWSCAMDGLGTFMRASHLALHGVEAMFKVMGRLDLADFIPRIKLACDEFCTQAGMTMDQWSNWNPEDDEEDHLEHVLGDIDDEIDLLSPDCTIKRLQWLIDRRDQFIAELP